MMEKKTDRIAYKREITIQIDVRVYRVAKIGMEHEMAFLAA